MAAPDIPTVSDAGLPDFVSPTWNTISAPAGTPDDLVERINEVVNGVVRSPSIRERLVELASLVPPAMTPQEVDASYARQREIWIPVVRGTGATRNAG